MSIAYIITNSLNSLLPMRARCGRMNSPLVLNTRSTGAEVAGEQKTFSKSACKSSNAGFRLQYDYDPQFFRSFFTVHQKTFSVFYIFLD